MKIEREIKIELTEEEFNKLVPQVSGFHLERTFGYFKENFSNIGEGVFPRIKHIESEKGNGEIVLTVKVKKVEDNRIFEREETEVRIEKGESLEDLRNILKSLGFTKEVVFEKKRRNLSREDVVISFDVLPFGFFVEFEGEPGAIEKYVREFNLLGKPRIIRSYLGLWEDYKNRNGIKENDCLFSKKDLS